MLKTFPKTHITIAAAATVVVTTAILMSPSSDVEAKRMSYSLDLNGNAVTNSASAPKESTPVATEDTSTSGANGRSASAHNELASAKPAEDQAPKLNWQEHKIQSGDTLSSLFRDAGFNDAIMLKVIHGEGDASKLQRLYAGETIAFATDANGDLAAIDLQRSLLETLRISRNEDGFKGETVVLEPEARPAFASGVIDGSLYVAAREAGMSDRLAMEMAGIFGWDIDFVYDVRKGDRFEVVYEELYLDGEKFDTGRILSARFINRGEDNVALLYTDSNGDSDYYAPDGSSMRKAFLRTPINARLPL